MCCAELVQGGPCGAKVKLRVGVDGWPELLLQRE